MGVGYKPGWVWDTGMDGCGIQDGRLTIWCYIKEYKGGEHTFDVGMRTSGFYSVEELV